LLNFIRIGWIHIKTVVMSIIMLAIAIGLIVGVIIPLADSARSSGNDAYLRGKTVGNEIENILR